nr:hypothetical protein CFP56_13402 [Quercus suber]
MSDCGDQETWQPPCSFSDPIMEFYSCRLVKMATQPLGLVSSDGCELLGQLLKSNRTESQSFEAHISTTRGGRAIRAQDDPMQGIVDSPGGASFRGETRHDFGKPVMKCRPTGEGLS